MVFLNVIQRDGDAAQMWSARLDSSPGGKIPTSPSRGGNTGKGVILFYLFFYFDSILFIYSSHALMLTACLFAGGPRARLPRASLVPSFRDILFFSSAADVVVSSGAADRRDCRLLCAQLAMSVIQMRLSG